MADIKVVTPEGRFRWLNVFEGKLNYKGNANEKSATLLISKKSSLAQLESAWTEVAQAEFKGKIPGALRRITGGQKPILKDGDEVYATKDEEKKEMYEAYRGCWVLAATCPEEAPLRVLGPDSTDIYDPADIYDGAYGQLVINLSCYTAKSRPTFPGGAMCSVTLLGVKKTRDGEPIEGGSGSVKLTDADVANLFGTVASSADDL